MKREYNVIYHVQCICTCLDLLLSAYQQSYSVN